ncbi:hypothetical protein [Pseudonocardia oroxyli]|uniref:Uncharacterized protein n=1 Tax=Pseudonocardia oroxyli TaxID=366584 RepID=A0A1G7UKG0_PSEOR|nr:hypothetical protein [Pseudonocardia oroxyli]SDG48075.1 hypothetical protein SAMN05216377_11276 [Pseudonocardia oroxyli]
MFSYSQSQDLARDEQLAKQMSAALFGSDEPIDTNETDEDPSVAGLMHDYLLNNLNGI